MLQIPLYPQAQQDLQGLVGQQLTLYLPADRPVFISARWTAADGVPACRSKWLDQPWFMYTTDERQRLACLIIWCQHAA